MAETRNFTSSPHSMESRDQTGTARNERILNCLYQNPEAVFKLICFPWAGGGSVYFAKWGAKIDDLLEVHAVRLAGRESRLEEPFANDIYQVSDEIVSALLPVIQDKSFAFFGHSFGAHFAFMTALHLKEKYKLEPVHFFISSATPRHSKSWPRIPDVNEVSEEEALSYLMDVGGTPKHLFKDEEFVQQCIPVLKADVKVVHNFSFDSPSKPLLSCDLTCFVGSEDIVKDIEAWKDVTSGKVDTHVLPGDHFYLMQPDNENFLKNYITKCLELSLLAIF